jgi:hypothetical protein
MLSYPVVSKLLVLPLAALVAAQLGVGLAGSVRGFFGGGSSGPCGRVAAAPSPARTSSANLVVNDGFELDTNGWTPWRAGITRDPCFALFGSASLEVVSSEGDQFLARYDVTLSGRATAGRVFAGSMWVYVPAKSHLIGKQMALQFGEDYIVFRNVAFVTLRRGWQKLSGEYTIADDGRRSVEIAPFVTSGAAAGDAFHLDGVQLREVR